ncbi:MAG: hypothetical protein BGN98_05685 [Microbacterium sp. 69-7]|uniref:NAD-dependent epimerase/dehydratase family protein n=1 Tax=Microbacterium sp. 69-7 TaxID=1895784 RepID=UPI00092626A4|nr:NAD-dependent epimerase/dehydratase family protein [Microbacterium sp. 69-7]OJU43472.1 MAG: hypothetical protein BGN98_05685 [Microbacterium sp. 69-7]OJX65660.1 MAG: hypothetical protein BGO95_08830 [Micrococcales bacterium 73-13]
MTVSPFPRTLVVGRRGPIGEALSRIAIRTFLPIEFAGRSGPLRMDVRSPEDVEAVLLRSSPEAIIYLVRGDTTAGRDFGGEAARDLRTFALAARAHGARRVVFASSAAVYGDHSPTPHRESDPLEGTSSYAIEKIRAERAIDRIEGLSTVSLRVFNVFGPRCDKSLLNALVSGPPPVLSVTPNFVRDYVHVDDVARAMVRAVGRATVRGAVNIGSGRAVDNTELAAARPGSFVWGSEAVRSFSLADVTRARTELGWWPEIDPIDFVAAGTLPAE